MKRSRFSLAWLLALLGAHAALLAQTDKASPEAQRSALSAERERQTLVFDAAERACYARFFTSDCLNDVARSRRAMLADIQRKEAALNAADRQQRGQDELQRLQEKQQAHEAQLQAIDAAAIEQAQREKQAARDAKLREHASKAAPPPSGGSTEAPSGSSTGAPSGGSTGAPSGGATDAASGGSTDAASGSQAPASQPASPSKPPKQQTGPSEQERAANQAAFEKKQAQAQRRVAEREQARAKAAASAVSAPRALPLPPPVPRQ